MSVVLLVRLKHALAVADLERASSAALRGLLNLECEPVVSAGFDETDKSGQISDRVLTGSSRRVICSVERHAEEVVVSPFTVPVQSQTDGDSLSFVDQDYISVGWHFKKTALSWALVAAVAIGAAKSEDSEIEDNSGFFSTENVQRADDFLSRISLPTSHSDAQVAADAFYVRLPKSAEIAEWLQAT